MGKRFKLESVLNHRRYLEDRAQSLFAESSRRWNEARRGLDGLRQNRSQYAGELKNKIHADATADDLLRYHRFLGRLDSEIKAQKVVVEELAADREDKRSRLMEALKDRKAIEKLKERYLEKEARRDHVQEQKVLNDAALHRFQGNSDPSGHA